MKPSAFLIVAALVAVSLNAPRSLAWAGGVGANSSPAQSAPARPAPNLDSLQGPALIDVAPGQTDARIRALAGLPAAGSAAQGWPCSAAQLSRFAARNMPEASAHVRRVGYFFGGVDFVYPDLLFPNMDHLLLVAMQPVGRIPNSLPNSAGRIQNAFRALNGCGTRSTYGITKDMAAEQAGLGVSTLIATAVAARGHRVDEIEAIALDANGVIRAPSASGGARGVRVAYTKANGVKGDVVYVQMKIEDGDLESSGLAPLVRAGQYDAAFYKASMYIPSWLSAANQLMLDNVRYVVQSDDGIPMAQFGPQWEVRLFGAYAAPSSMFGVNSQPKLYQAYASSICESTRLDRSVGLQTLSQAWGRTLDDRACSLLPRAGSLAGGVSWGGMIEGFPYSYSAASGPGDSALKLRTSNLQYGIKK